MNREAEALEGGAPATPAPRGPSQGTGVRVRRRGRQLQRGLTGARPSKVAEMIRADFFRRDPLTCARALIGCELIWDRCGGIVVETEAYNAIGDEACHCFVRPSTRAFLERNKAGAAYIYFNYGVHWMLNVLVKGTENGFVLIRALEPTRGIALMRRRRGVRDMAQLCSGPGKLTQALAITKKHDEMDLCADERHSFRYPFLKNFEERMGTRRGEPLRDAVHADARIGIRRSAELPWRFTLRGNKHVSRKSQPA